MLTVQECRNAVCPTDKARKRLPDAGRLYLGSQFNGLESRPQGAAPLKINNLRTFKKCHFV